MLLKFGNQYLLNLDSLSCIRVESDNNLVATIPSAESENGYRDVYLGVSGFLECVTVLSDIVKQYTQYLITSNGELFVPPKVVNISQNTQYIKSSNVRWVNINWDSHRIRSNKLYLDVTLVDTQSGKQLIDNVDYTAEYPMYKGPGIVHTIVYTLKKSNTKYNFQFYSKKNSS